MTKPKKRVAILSPIAWRTPPRQYGAWETVASNITEGLVARGWDVTLFASRDSVTRARLHAVVDKGYEEDPAVDPKVAEYLHISEAFERAAEFDLIHSHYDFMALTYTRLIKTRASRRRAWENLAEIRWVLKDTTGMELPPPARRTIDLEGRRIVKDGVKKALRDRQDALSELVDAVRLFRKLADSKPLTLQGTDFAKAVERLNVAIDRAEGLTQ
jgi:hypothetical protein